MNKHKRILAFDPGVTSGVAFTPEAGVYITCVAKTPEEAWSFIDPELVDLVIYENFVAQLISRFGLHTVRVVGGIQARCDMYKIPIVTQTPQQRRAFVDVAKKYLIENRGGTGTGDHEKDALAHILSYEWRRDNNG